MCSSDLITVALARETPDVVLVDIRMPVVDRLRATREIAADPDLAGVHVLILTTSTTTSTSSRHWAQAPPFS